MVANWQNPKARRPIGEIEKDIRHQVRLKKPHWNNLVQSYLEEADQHHGKGTADRLILLCKLEPLGWKTSVELAALGEKALGDAAREALEQELARLNRELEDAVERRKAADVVRLEGQIRRVEQKLGIGEPGKEVKDED